jgi:hypothetical protein
MTNSDLMGMALQNIGGLRSDTGYCGHCKVHVSFRKLAPIELAPSYHAGPPASTAREVVIKETLICSHCGAATLVLLFFNEFEANVPVDSQQPARTLVVYPAPTPRALDPSVPEKIRGLFEEAALCEVHGALRAAAVMYRAAVEEMCAHLGAAGNNLFDRIEALAGLGLDTTVVEDMHEARMLGNDSIHKGLVYAPDEVADVAELIEEALVVLFVQRAQRAAFRERRRERREQARQPSAQPATPANA